MRDRLIDPLIMLVYISTMFLVVLLSMRCTANSMEPEVAPARRVGSDPICLETMDVIKLEMEPDTERQEPPVEPEPVDKPAYDQDLPLSEDLQAALWDACAEFGVDYPLMLALIEHETNFRNLTGDDGRSVGYCQIQERWWRGLMEEIGAEDLRNPRDNFRTGCAIVAQLTARYGNVRDALSAYNTGSPGVTTYANAVLAASEKWK